jgi:Fe-S-cluster containining protein
VDIHFDCTQCGRCCHNLKLPLSVDEAIRWAGNGHPVQILVEAAPAFEEPAAGSPERFRFDRSFPAMSGTIPIRVGVILAASFEGACPHLGPDMLCGDYEARPRVCRIYPAEVSPNIELAPAAKACPPEAWSDDHPVLLRGGIATDPALASLIEGHRAATLADVDAKARVCDALGINATAFLNEGYAVHSPEPALLVESLAMTRLDGTSIDDGAQWRFATNRGATLAMLDLVEARAAKTASGADYIGFFDDDPDVSPG